MSEVDSELLLENKLLLEINSLKAECEKIGNQIRILNENYIIIYYKKLPEIKQKHWSMVCKRKKKEEIAEKTKIFAECSPSLFLELENKQDEIRKNKEKSEVLSASLNNDLSVNKYNYILAEMEKLENSNIRYELEILISNIKKISPDHACVNIHYEHDIICRFCGMHVDTFCPYDNCVKCGIIDGYCNESYQNQKMITYNNMISWVNPNKA